MSAEHFAALTCAWLVSYFAQSTLLLSGVWVCTRRLSARFDRLAELAWRLALGLPVMTSLAQLSFTGRAVEQTLALEYTPPPLSVTAVPSLLWLGVATIWIAGAVLGVVQLILIFRSLRQAIADRQPVSPAILERIAGVTGVRVTHISVVEELAVPLALRYEVCLPARLIETMDPEELRSVIAHELAHVKRRDAIWRPVAALVARCFFFQPLNWLACARLRELSECLCDEDAVEATRSPLPLASALHTLAASRSVTSRRVDLVPAMDAPLSFTVERVRRILARSRSTLRIRRSVGGSVATAAAVAAFMIAPRMTLPPTAFLRYTINAQDPAGPFTVTVEKGSVIGATVQGRPLAPSQVIQHGRSVRIVDSPRGAFSIELTSQGGIRWTARRRGG